MHGMLHGARYKWVNSLLGNLSWYGEPRALRGFLVYIYGQSGYQVQRTLGGDNITIKGIEQKEVLFNPLIVLYIYNGF